MRLTQTLVSDVNLIRGYGAGQIQVNETAFTQAIILGAGTLSALPAPFGVGDLTAEVIGQLMALNPEVVLVGTGARQIFPAPEIAAEFLKRGIGFDVMDTGAACRTYNVLVGERRAVVALLMP